MEIGGWEGRGINTSSATNEVASNLGEVLSQRAGKARQVLIQRLGGFTRRLHMF